LRYILQKLNKDGEWYTIIGSSQKTKEDALEVLRYWKKVYSETEFRVVDERSEKERKPEFVEFIAGPLDGLRLDPETGEISDPEDLERTRTCNDGIPEGFQHHYKMFPEWSGMDLIYLGVKPHGYKHTDETV